ncbi:CidA/LrgA family protein [Acinetobacter chinensis]|jgi:holin-like protein|uniref:CidA/LrgA family protein n=1 Tax=Acinetobacter chinensis TaxID=2004650 RepID=UPI002934A000|nr:CidA/LrgA family protein [Acinetobacter chinensis]WOE40017.1 CidA/LrgA family protein [Acinetobacter chinensis]
MSITFRSLNQSVLLKIIFQLSLLIFIWWIGSVLQKLLNIPVSAGVIGLFLMLFALLSGVFKLQWIKSGSDFILGELVLFFIPCVVGLIKYKHLFITQGWQMVVAVVIGTVTVMVSTAYAVHFGFKLESRLQAHHKPASHDHPQEMEAK